MRRISERQRKWTGSILFFAGLLAVWQLLYVAGTKWLGVVKPYAVPSPVGVWKTACRLLSDGTLQMAAAKSLARGLGGFAIAIVIGVIFGIMILHSTYLCRNLKPLILGIQTLPSVCWVPFAILWFGLSENAILFVIVMGSAFSVALAVESGVKNVPPIYIKAAKTMGLNQTALYCRVIFPAALPAFVGGLKQGWSFAWRALMSGEVMSASIGLGYTLILGRDLADINQVMTVMLVIVAIGILMDKGVFSQIENRILRKRGLA